MNARAVTVILLMCACVSVAAQTPEPRLEDYEAAVRAYASGGDITAAVLPLQYFTRKHFDAAVDRLMARRDQRLANVAAVFQLEVGIGVIGLSPAAAAGHLNLGQKLLDGGPRPLSSERQLFLATWLGVAGSVFLSVNDAPRARPWIQKALDLQPQSAALRTLLGAAQELDAAAWDPEFWTTTSQKARALMQRSRRLLTAEETFRTALQNDPSYTLAEIRLGRIHFLREEVDAARVTLERAEMRAREAHHRYLAALFLGAVHQRQNRTDAARAAYERALTISPRSQTAAVALGYIELLAGRADRAQALARAFASATAGDDRHWWAYKNGGLDEAGLAWLREQVMK